MARSAYLAGVNVRGTVLPVAVEHFGGLNQDLVAHFLHSLVGHRVYRWDRSRREEENGKGGMSTTRQSNTHAPPTPVQALRTLFGHQV